MRIPEAAVEAAAKADYGDGWDSATEWERSAYLDHSKQLIEAATPHMLAEATALICDLTDREECSFDHHGGCQAHGYLSLDTGETCPQADAKEWALTYRPGP